MALRQLVIVVCAIGCLCHLVILNADYFKYETVASLAPYVALTQVMPLVSLCFVPSDAGNLNASFIEQRLPVNMSRDDTISQVNASAVIADCRLRNFTTGRLEAAADCSSLFHATQSFKLSYYQCYTLSVRNNSRFSTLEVAASMVDKYILYSFRLREQFAAFNRMSFFNHITALPQGELRYLTDIDMCSKHGKDSWFLLSYELVEFRRLKYPYRTNCVDCHPLDCSSHAEHQRSACGRDLCRQTLTVTHIYRTAQESHGISLRVRSQGASTQLVKYTAKCDVSTFFIQVCSVLGLWCSLSFVFFAQNLMRAFDCSRQKYSRHFIHQWNNELLLISRKANIDLAKIKQKVRDNFSAPSSYSEGLLRRSIKIFAKLVIFVLFVRETTIITIDYFAYATRMETDIDVKAVVNIPSINHCFDINLWMNLGGPWYQFEHYDESVSSFMRKINYTVRELLDFAPGSVERVIKKCRVRSSFNSSLTSHDDCSTMFNVTKFYHNEFLCYYFTPLAEYKLSMEFYRRGDDQPAILYSIVPMDTFARTSHFQPIVSIGLPSESRFLANRLFRERDRELIILSFLMYKHAELPSPYDTNCQNTYNLEECISTCMNLSQVGLISSSQLHSVPLDLRIVNYKLLKNESLAKLVREAEIRCYKLCRPPCANIMTKTIQLTGYSSDERFELALAHPMYPMYELNAIPLFTLFGYIYQLACSASFWIGFSVLCVMLQFAPKKQVHTILLHFDYLSRVTERLESAVRRKYAPSRRDDERPRGKKFGGRVRKGISLCVTVIGFTVQSFLTASEYFKYPTTLNTRLTFERDFADFKGTVCVTLDQLDLQGNLSLANIWMKSPREEDIVLECGHRGLSLPHLSHLPKMLQRRILAYINSRSVCNSLFAIKKKVTLAMVCYELNPKEDASKAEYDPRYHTHSMKVHQYFTLSNVLARYNLTVVFSQGSPRVSLLFGVTVPSTNSSKCLWNWISYSKCYVKSLPYPYQTNNLNFFQEWRCQRKCVSQATEGSFNRLASYGETDHVKDLAHESLDQSVSRLSQEMRRECEKKCLKDTSVLAIETSYTRTFHDGPFEDSYDKGETGTNGLWFRNSDYFVPHTNLYPTMRLVDLVLYIGSIYSIWFGLSALHTVDVLFENLLDSSLHSRPDENPLDRLVNLRKILTGK